MIYLLVNVLFFTVIAFVMNRKNINYDFKLILKKHLGKIIAVSCIVIFIVLGTIINKILNNPVVGYCIALMPAFLPYLVYDLVKSATFKKEQQGITSLLMVLTKWSSVRNDVVYCLQKTDETKLSEPIGGYIREMCIRLEKGMSVSEALTACEENALSEELRYVLINIRYAYEKGGSLYRIFKSLENQFFKIDEENFKRKINTLSDKYAVYLSIVMVMATFYMVVLNKGQSGQYYLKTETGMLLLGVFALLFFAGMLIITKVVKRY